MKTFLIITIFITALLHSCASYENKIIGQWVEKNNYKAPRILEFTKDYYTKPHNQNDLITFPYYRQAQYLYKVREDTLFQCSDIDVFKEVAGDAALFFNPEIPQDIAETIYLVLSDDSLRNSQILKGKKRSDLYRWDKIAQQIVSIYKEIN